MALYEIIFVLALSLVTYSQTAVPTPGDKVEFIELKPLNQNHNDQWGKVLTDIMTHEAPFDKNKYEDLITLGHETSHGIHSYIRNCLNNLGKRANGFYVLNSLAALVIEPNIRKSQVGPYVPKSLRGSRFDLYVTGQTVWDDTPLYLFDEWNAYINGGTVGVDLVQQNLWNAGWRDGVFGIIEFVVYALATAQAVKEHDPQYFDHYSQFTEFLAWNIKRSMETYLIGSKLKEFKWDKQDDYYDKLIHSPDAEPLRKFARETFGASWTLEVLGF